MLHLFDIDGTVARSYMREGGGGTSQAYDLVEILPGRRERLDALRADGHDIALVTNQGGVAFGYKTVEQVTTKMLLVLDALGFPVDWNITPLRTDPQSIIANPAQCYAALTHPNARLDAWRANDGWRKPGGGMLRRAMSDYGTSSQQTIFVGDMDSDRQAARAAGVLYVEAKDFFA